MILAVLFACATTALFRPRRFSTSFDANDAEGIVEAAMRPNMRFSAVKHSKVLPDRFTTQYASVCVFGPAEILPREERRNVLLLFVEKHCKGFEQQGREKVEKQTDNPEVVAIRVKRITGKACSG